MDEKECLIVMTHNDKIKLRQQVVETYDQLIANTEDLSLRQYFIEEKLKVEQRINEFWMRKVLLSNPTFVLLIAPMNTNQVVLELPMSSPTESQARFEVAEELMAAFTHDGIKLYNGDFLAIVVRKAFHDRNVREVNTIMNDKNTYIDSRSFRVTNGAISWI